VKVPALTRAHLAMAVAIMFAVGSAAGLSWAFTAQLAHSRELRVEELLLEQALADAKEQHEQLLELEQLVQTDAFVEDWARKSLVWVREGETTIVFVDPLPTPELPTQPVVDEVQLEDRPMLLELWELIVGR
jgi:hypothetical protein